MHFYVDLSLVCVIILSVCFIISKTAGLRKEKIKIVSENMGIFYTAGKLACFGISKIIFILDTASSFNVITRFSRVIQPYIHPSIAV